MSKLVGTFSHAGIPGLDLREVRIIRSPQYGLQYEYEYEGSPAAIVAGYNQTASDQIAVLHKTPDGELWRLTVTTSDDPSNPTSQVVNNDYELAGNTIQKDIKEHPIALQIGYVGMKTLLDQLAKATASEITDEAAEDAIEEAVPAYASNAVTLYRDLRVRDGQMSFDISQFVFRWTVIVGRRSEYQLAYANVNKLFTFPQLIVEVNPPSGYIISLTKILELCEPSIIPTGYAWRWKKGTPTVSQAPGNRFAIQIDYELYTWSTQYYEASTSPSA
jgi:hypothetical protein